MRVRWTDLRRLSDPYWWLNRFRGPFGWAHRRFARLGFEAGAPQVAFLIKLIGPSDAVDWAVVAERLQLTLDSIDRQGCDAHVFICGQVLPEGLRSKSTLHFVPAPEQAQRVHGLDKDVKHRLAARAIAETLDGPAYVVLIDADDIMHDGLIRYVLDDNNGRGYLIDAGYMWDVAQPRLAPLAQEPSGMPFYLMCGSCAVIAVDLSRKRLSKRLLCTLPRNHQMTGSHLEAMGLPLEPVPFPAMLYAVNHVDNTSTRHGRDGARGWLFAEHGIEGAAAEDILRDFGVESAAAPHSAEAG